MLGHFCIFAFENCNVIVEVSASLKTNLFWKRAGQSANYDVINNVLLSHL